MSAPDDPFALMAYFTFEESTRFHTSWAEIVDVFTGSFAGTMHRDPKDGEVQLLGKGQEVFLSALPQGLVLVGPEGESAGLMQLVGQIFGVLEPQLIHMHFKTIGIRPHRKKLKNAIRESGTAVFGPLFDDDAFDFNAAIELNSSSFKGATIDAMFGIVGEEDARKHLRRETVPRITWNKLPSVGAWLSILHHIHVFEDGADVTENWKTAIQEWQTLAARFYEGMKA